VTKWLPVKLADVATLNPTRPRELLNLDDSYAVTFVPMSAVNQYSGEIDGAKTRTFGEVKKGFTHFAEGDVIFAKITPCMQNGKSAIASGLVNGLGFGSTEFHVIRPNVDRLLPEWVWYFVRQTSFRYEGMRHFRGAVGQQRVPVDYVGNANIPLPPVPEQRRIVSRIKACMERVEEIERDAAAGSREISALFPAILNEGFAQILAHHQSEVLEEVADIRGGCSLPQGTPTDHVDESVLLVKVGDMNMEGNERVLSVSREFLAKGEAGRSAIPEGAVILPKRGGAIATNKKRMLGRPALIDPNLMAVVARRDVLSAEYLYYWSLTLDLTKLSNGGVIPQLNRKDLAPLPVPIPPLDAQQQIVETLKRSETCCAQLRTESDSAQADRAQLRESILRKAFAGEL